MLARAAPAPPAPTGARGPGAVFLRRQLELGTLIHAIAPRLRLQRGLSGSFEERLSEDALAIYRKRHELLSADEIRAIRDQFNLTQADLARLLRLGANTVSRWESGRNVQTAAMDILLRRIRDLPGSIDYLRDHAA